MQRLIAVDQIHAWIAAILRTIVAKLRSARGAEHRYRGPSRNRTRRKDESAGCERRYRSGQERGERGEPHVILPKGWRYYATSGHWPPSTQRQVRLGSVLPIRLYAISQGL